MTDRSKIIALLYKHFVGACDDTDKELLDKWLAESAENRAIFERLSKQDSFRKDFFQMVPQEDNVQSTMEHVLGKKQIAVEVHPNTFAKRIKKYLPYAAAASVILAIAIGYPYFNTNPATEERKVILAEDILAGGNAPYVKLASGKRVELKNQTEGLVTSAAGMGYADGTLVLAPDMGNAVEDYELHTPKGSSYQIKLSDGTKVWLNAASKLVYPNYFTGDKRIVRLEGEAYFEVSKSEAPFIVQTAQQEVQVLGTMFNIHAYPEDLRTATTLLEGSVLVTNANTKKQLKLSPGQQAMVNTDALFVKKMNVQDAIAWKSGKFSFEEKSFKEVMNELARWYDLKIVYKGEIPNATFFGDAYRSNNLGIVLAALQSAEIDYTIEEGKVLVITGKKGGGRP